MASTTIIIPDDIFITFSNGWEIHVPAWAFGVAAIALLALIAALAIWAVVRAVNRRPRRQLPRPD